MFIVTDLVSLRVLNENLIFLFLNQNICCGYSNGPLDIFTYIQIHTI